MAAACRLLDVRVRPLHVPAPLGAAVIQTEHRMRPGTAAEVRLVVPRGQVVPAGISRLRPVGDLIVLITGGLQPRLGSPVLLELIIRTGHLDEPGPPLLAEAGSRFNR